MPALSHWFGLHPWDLDDLTVSEFNEFMQALRKLPPPGWVFMGQPSK